MLEEPRLKQANVELRRAIERFGIGNNGNQGTSRDTSSQSIGYVVILFMDMRRYRKR